MQGPDFFLKNCTIPRNQLEKNRLELSGNGCNRLNCWIDTRFVPVYRDCHARESLGVCDTLPSFVIRCRDSAGADQGQFLLVVVHFFRFTMFVCLWNTTSLFFSTSISLCLLSVPLLTHSLLFPCLSTSPPLCFLSVLSLFSYPFSYLLSPMSLCCLSLSFHLPLLCAWYIPLSTFLSVPQGQGGNESTTTQKLPPPGERERQRENERQRRKRERRERDQREKGREWEREDRDTSGSAPEREHKCAASSSVYWVFIMWLFYQKRIVSDVYRRSRIWNDK